MIPDSDRDLESLTLGMSLRLEELVGREPLGEMVRSFYALFGIPIRIFSAEGVLLADATKTQPICEYVNTFRQGSLSCSATVNGAKRAEPGPDGEATHPCFTGAVYHIVSIEYDARRLGKVILGPYLPSELAEVPGSLLAVDASFDPVKAKELLPKLPRAKADTIKLIAEHLKSSLDLILFSGHKALLTSQMHLATVRESYRELQEKNHKLQEAFDRLKELDRLKSNFLGTVSHELRTPLTSIIGYGEMLAEGIAGPLADEQKEFVQTIRDKSEQLLSLIMSLLDLSKLESGTMSLRKTSMSVGKVVEEVASTLAPTARKRSITIEHAVADGLPEITADPERLRQVVLNLADNAIKFSPEGGVVRITVGLSTAAPGSGDDDDDDGIVLLAPQRSVMEIRVVDEGIGIPQLERGRVFDAFYQVDSSSTREYGGTGLGLSIVKRLVEGHGGTVEALPNEPKGAVFSVKLPLDPPKQK